MKILAISAHPDDCELSCAGTLLKARVSGNEIYRLIVAPVGNTYSRKIMKEQARVNDLMGYKESYYLSKRFRANELDFSIDLVDGLDGVLNEIGPNVVFTHWPGDHHQDHQAVYKAVWAAMRNVRASLICFSGPRMFDFFSFNMEVDISKQLEGKVDLLKEYKSQQDRYYFKKIDPVERFLVKRLVL